MLERMVRTGLGAAVVAAAVTAGAATAAAEDIGRFTVGAGAYDVLQQDDNLAAAFDVEWRPGVRYFDVIAPFAGGFVTGERSTYGYVGFGLEFVIADQFVIMPFTGAGLYARGAGNDLGGPVQFRNGLELGYRFDNGSQIGVSGSHISNANIYDENPGTEVLMLHYSVPTGWFFSGE